MSPGEPAPLFTDIADAPDGGRAVWLRADDGVRIRVGHWPGNGRGTVLLFPGRTEYVEKYGRIAGELTARGLDVLVVDWRGQGLADRLTGDPLLGHVERFADYQRDVAAVRFFAEHLGLPRPWYLLSHSMGGCIGLRALHEGLPVAAASFTAPMWGILLSPVMRPIAHILSFVASLTGNGASYAPGTGKETYVLTAPFEDNMLTTNRESYEWLQEQARKHPELTLAGPSLHWLREALKETRALARMAPPPAPAMTFLAGNERIVDPRPIREMMAVWPNGQLKEMPGAEHEIMMERPETRNVFLEEFDSFLSAHAPQG